MTVAALLTTALLFGGMTFFSFGFAPVLFKQLPATQVRPLLRGTFPHYYLVVVAIAVLASALIWLVQGVSLAFGLVVFTAVSTLAARQILMPMINDATDADNTRRFGVLHGASVVLQLIQLGLAGWALALLA